MKKSFMIKFRELIYISKCKILHSNILITIDKTCENVLRLKVELTSTTIVKIEKFHSYNKTIIDFNFGRHEDLSTLKSDIRPSGLGELSLFG